MLDAAGVDVAKLASRSDRSAPSKPFKGACVCGAIRYTAQSLRPLWFCHCQQCRKMTGHFMAAAQADLDQIEISGEPKWYYVNNRSRYGFCADCGSQLFWHNDDNEFLSVTGGSIDDASGLPVKGHIFASEKGHYYEIPQGELQYSEWCQSGEI